jgi:hypothetical protein
MKGGLSRGESQWEGMTRGRGEGERGGRDRG